MNLTKLNRVKKEDHFFNCMGFAKIIPDYQHHLYNRKQIWIQEKTTTTQLLLEDDYGIQNGLNNSLGSIQTSKQDIEVIKIKFQTQYEDKALFPGLFHAAVVKSTDEGMQACWIQDHRKGKERDHFFHRWRDAILLGGWCHLSVRAVCQFLA